MTRIELARRLRPIIEKAVQSLDDATALDAVTLYPKWEAATVYETDTRVRHGDTLYRVLQPHTAQAAWTPDAAPSLFAKVLIPDPNTIPAWEQPDSTNPYMMGDKVMYDGKIWVCTVDNNVWMPSVYGWEEYSA